MTVLDFFGRLQAFQRALKAAGNPKTNTEILTLRVRMTALDFFGRLQAFQQALKAAGNPKTDTEILTLRVRMTALDFSVGSRLFSGL
jgi:nucleoid DNA-binding protein